MADVELYFPKKKETVKLSEKDMLQKENETKDEFLNRKLEVDRQLDKHEKGLFSSKMKVQGLMCGQCSWLQFSEEEIIKRGEGTPRCWLYNALRVVKGKEASDRQESFDTLECVGETDADFLAGRVMRVPGFIKARPVRKIWFKKRFPKGYKALSKHQRAILLMRGGTLYTKAQLKAMAENERKIAEKKVEEEARKRKKKMKGLIGRIPISERVILRAELIEKIAKKRLAVLRKADRMIKFYSTQYQKWSGKKFYFKLIDIISSDLARLYNYYLAARTVRHFRDVSDLYSLLSANFDAFGETKKVLPPLKVLNTAQVKFYAPLFELGVFDFGDFTKKSGARLKRYMKRRKIKPTKKLPIKLSEAIHSEWMAVEKYKDWRKNQPTINADFLEALNTPTYKLLAQVRLDETGAIIVKKMPLSKRIALLNAVYVKYARPFGEKVREQLLAESLNLDKKYLSTSSHIVSTVKVPLEKSEMVVLTKKSKNVVLDMPVEKLQKYRKQIEEDVRYSPKYKKYVDGIIDDLSELDKEFVKLRIDPVMDIEPKSQLQYKDLSPIQKMQAWDDAQKAIKELERRFKKMGLKGKSRLRFGEGEKEVKRLDKMTFTEKSKFLARVLDKRKKKKADKEALAKAEKEKKPKKKVEPEVEVPEKVVRSVRDEVEGIRSNMRVLVEYDISGSVLDVWNVENYMMGKDKKWHSFVPTRKREMKRGRKIFKRLLAKLSEIEGVDIIAVEPEDRDRAFLKAMGFKDMDRKAKKRVMGASAFNEANIERMKLYMG